VAPTGTFHHLKVIAHGGRIQMFFGNATRPSLDVVDSSFRFGGVALRTYRSAASFKNLSVVKNDPATLTAYALSAQFSRTQGGSGWRYQEMSGGTATDLTWNQARNHWKGGGAYTSSGRSAASTLKASNGNLVLARADEPSSPLRAVSTVRGDWEKFTWTRTPG
jgi:hypothetical protein